MSFSMEDLWSTAGDEKVIDAVSKWSSLNPEARRVVTTEVKRRGLAVSLPEPPAAPAASTAEAPAASSAKGLIMGALVIGILVIVALMLR